MAPAALRSRLQAARTASARGLRMTATRRMNPPPPDARAVPAGARFASRDRPRGSQRYPRSHRAPESSRRPPAPVCPPATATPPPHRIPQRSVSPKVATQLPVAGAPAAAGQTPCDAIHSAATSPPPPPRAPPPLPAVPPAAPTTCAPRADTCAPAKESARSESGFAKSPAIHCWHPADTPATPPVRRTESLTASDPGAGESAGGPPRPGKAPSSASRPTPRCPHPATVSTKTVPPGHPHDGPSQWCLPRIPGPPTPATRAAPRGPPSQSRSAAPAPTPAPMRTPSPPATPTPRPRPAQIARRHRSAVRAGGD